MKVGAVAGIISAIVVDLQAPPRLIGFFSGDIVDESLLLIFLSVFVGLVITSAFGARTAKN